MISDLRNHILAQLDLQQFYKRFVPLRGRSDTQGNLTVQCPFHNDGTPSLSINIISGLFHCFGCGEKGDVFAFYRAIKSRNGGGNLGAFPTLLEQMAAEFGIDSSDDGSHRQPTLGQIDQWQQALIQSELWLRYLHGQRGLTDETIKTRKLGWDGEWLTIPIYNPDGQLVGIKRHHPKKEPKYKNPTGLDAQLFGAHLIGEDYEGLVVVCEGEFDCMILWQQGVPAVTSTVGTGNLPEHVIEWFRGQDCAVIEDADEAGVKGAQKDAQKLLRVAKSVRIVALPLQAPLKDVTDFFVQREPPGTAEELKALIDRAIPAKREPSNILETVVPLVTVGDTTFPPITTEELLEILGHTIKRDEENKLITFLCELSAYTEDSQLNVMYNAPSSTGKSYIPVEIAAFFPSEDVIKIGYCSPTAFFHDVGRYVKDQRGYVLDLSRKILIFLDQPHTMLLQHLRPLLSHDEKEIQLKITDKSERGGLRTKNIFIKGFPAVIFCTGNLKMDEQEATRVFLLSPETSQEKLRAAIHEKIRREADVPAYQADLEHDQSRRILKSRIEAIRAAGIGTIQISPPHVAMIEARFLEKRAILKPRDMRDVGRCLGLVKGLALLNCWHRDRDGSAVTVSEADIQEAFTIWERVSVSQSYNLPPYVYQLFQEIIGPAYKAKGSGLTRKEIMQEHLKIYGRPLADWQLRQQILPMLDTAGLIAEEADLGDKRVKLVVPVLEI